MTISPGDRKPLVFIVGTGRCGSTMLSSILREHPDVLSLSEFFATLKTATQRHEIPTREMDGAELWRIISAPDPFYDAMICAGLRFTELAYPYDHGRFAPATGVPRIAHLTLPTLADDPDVLFDKLAAEVGAWPVRPAAAQYRALFGYLAGLLGRSVVVERTGASLPLVPVLHQQFPEARYLHLYRYGPDCALSMSRHPMFRLPALARDVARNAGLPFLSTDEIQAAALRLPSDLAGLVAPPFDAQRFMTREIPLAFFGELWSCLAREGAAALSQLPAGTWIGLKYEELVRDPEAELTKLAEFIGVPATPRWLAAGCLIADDQRVGTAASQLSPGDLATVQEACAPGIAAIAAVRAGRAPPAPTALRLTTAGKRPTSRDQAKATAGPDELARREKGTPCPQPI